MAVHVQGESKRAKVIMPGIYTVNKIMGQSISELVMYACNEGKLQRCNSLS